MAEAEKHEALIDAMRKKGVTPPQHDQRRELGLVVVCDACGLLMTSSIVVPEGERQIVIVVDKCTCVPDRETGLGLNALNYVRSRREYFANKDLQNGWSGVESGPCCENCVMRPEHFNGRADALKAVADCRNPFQIREVCQCHIPVRQAVRSGIVEAHDQLITALSKGA